jgi:hypothetical protein
MTSRPPDSPPDRLPAFGQGQGFLAGLVAIARLGLLAILFFGALNVLVSLFHGASVSRTAGATQGTTYLALALATASALLMVALVLNAAFLVDRLFSRRAAGVVFAAVLALAVGAIGVGHLGSAKLGAVTTVFVLIPAVPFVLSLLLTRLAGPSPAGRSRSRAAAGERPAAPRASQPPRQASRRQRRGGRKR